MRNYNSTTTGQPFIRVRDLRITYPQANTASITCTEELAVKLAGGEIRSLGDTGAFTFDVFPGDMQNEVNLVDPSTGQNLAGNPTVSYQQVMLGILATVRAEQISKDEAQA
jgi:hypothetical protein